MEAAAPTTKARRDPFTPQQRRRLCYFESRLIWDGKVHRKDVCEVFEVSENHFTRDLTLYRNHFDRNLRLNPTTKWYEPTEYFKPAFASGSAEEYLAIMLAYAQSGSAAVLDTIGAEVTTEQLPQPAGKLDPDLLRVLVRAIRNQSAVEARYQSLSQDKDKTRVLWPHALAFTGLRWHTRAFDESSGEYRDFALSRFINAAPYAPVAAQDPPSEADTTDRDGAARQEGPAAATDASAVKERPLDTLWHSHETVELIPNPRLGKAQREVIAREYGMTLAKGKWSCDVKVRCSLMGYFLHRYRLDLPESLTAKENIQLNNPELVERYRFK